MTQQFNSTAGTTVFVYKGDINNFPPCFKPKCSECQYRYTCSNFQGESTIPSIGDVRITYE